MSSSRWKKELQAFPELRLNDLASEPLRLVLAALAERDGMPVADWLRLRLRSMAALAMPNAVRECLFAGNGRRGVGPAEPLDYVALSMPQEESDVPDDGCLWWAADMLEPDIKEAVARLQLQNLQSVKPGKGQHELWKTPVIDRGTTFARDDHRKVWHQQLVEQGPMRQRVRVTTTMQRRVERLLVDAPNFREATLFVLGQLALARRGGRELRIPPLLLAGPPAAGKTWWAEKLAKSLGLHCECITLPSVSASFEISGGTSQWYSGAPGQVIKAFLRTPNASPLFVLDELDKAVTDGRYPVAPTLLGLIDRSAAVRWRDEFYDQEFDVSRSLFIATANRPERIDSALRSRFRRIDVLAPKRSERASIVASVWQEHRSLNAEMRLPRALDDELVEILLDQFEDARQLMRLFDDGLGRAARRRGPLRLLPSDVGGRVAWLAASTAADTSTSPKPN
ncbi:MAG: AAA family ATPase [Rhodanobacteraceae bacterium]|nr:AAA family ATPase [Rhodanobacteraceae bacterium]